MACGDIEPNPGQPAWRSCDYCLAPIHLPTLLQALGSPQPHANLFANPHNCNFQPPDGGIKTPLASLGMQSYPSGQIRPLTCTPEYGRNSSRRVATLSSCAPGGVKSYPYYGTLPIRGIAYRSRRCSRTTGALCYPTHSGPCGRFTSLFNQVLRSFPRLPYLHSHY